MQTQNALSTLLTSGQASQMPELRVLCFVSTWRIQYLDRYILPFTHTGPAFIFPDLEVLEFRGGASEVLKEEGRPLRAISEIGPSAKRQDYPPRDTSTPESLYSIMDLLRDNVPQLLVGRNLEHFY